MSQEEVALRVRGQWEPKWFVGWKEVTSSTNERTLIPVLLPFCGIGHKIPIAVTSTSLSSRYWLLMSCMASIVVDYICRQKLGSTSLTPFTVKQLPILPPEGFDEIAPVGHNCPRWRLD